MERIKRIREKMSQGGPVIGTFMVELRAAGAVAALTEGGLDFIMIDLEHGAFDMTEVTRLIDNAKHAGLCPIVRVPLNLQGLYTRVLDAGAEGILVPQVTTMEDVRQVVNVTKYYPVGRRGVHAIRPHTNFVPFADPRKFMDQANEHLATIIQIETPEAAALADEIAATEGVDGLYIGPSDLSTMLGHAGNSRHEDIVKIMIEVGAACKKHGKIAGYHIEPGQLPQLMENGYRFFGYKCSQRLLVRGAESLVQECKSALANS